MGLSQQAACTLELYSEFEGWQEDLEVLAGDQPHCPIWVMQAVWGLKAGQDSWFTRQQHIY